MANMNNTYQPDYAVPPGWLVQEILEERGWSMRDLASYCDRSPKLISEIIAGKAPIGADTAIQFEKVLKVDARVWVNMEAQYRLALAREEEAEELEEYIEWAKRFPIRELIKFGVLKDNLKDVDLVKEIIEFFGLAGFKAWEKKYCSDNAAVAFRHSPSFKSSPEALSAWLRIGEIAAEEKLCPEYNEADFKKVLREIKGLSLLGPEKFCPMMKEMCASAGVIFLLVPPLPGVRLSGIARWLSPGKAVIQQTLRHKTNDHFWFTFFHEAAHILLHSKKDVFIDVEGQNIDKEEAEANEWSANFLIAKNELAVFAKGSNFTMSAVKSFARQQGIAPGIVVGQLQKCGIIPWNSLNSLKERYEWKI